LLKFTKFGKDSQGLGRVRHNSVLKTMGQKESFISIDPFNGEFGLNYGSHKNLCRKKKILFA